MGQLLSCPFCRELFTEEEGPACPECDLKLVPLEELPLSLDAQAELAQNGLVDPPEDQRLPWWFYRRGRAATAIVGACGLLLFFAPWVHLQRPDNVSLSGHDLASTNAPWLWGGAIGFFLLIPLALSRRTVREMHGVRVIASFFSVLTLGEAGMLLFNPPSSQGYFSVGLQYAWGIYASALVAAVGIAVSARLGGSAEDFRDLPIVGHADGPTRSERVH